MTEDEEEDDLGEEEQGAFKRQRIDDGEDDGIEDQVAFDADGGEEDDEEDYANVDDDGPFGEALSKMADVQNELEAVNDEASEKVLEVEQKYNRIRRPIYDKRNEIISTVKDFWRTAFLNHPTLSQLFTEEDQKLFSYVTEMSVEDFDDVKSGYRISFSFSSDNPYFFDAKLVKEFKFAETGGVDITAQVPEWREGMSGALTAEEGRTQTFFGWFIKSEALPAQHDPVADYIKDDIWPNPLRYFKGEVEWMNDEEEEEEDDDEYQEDGVQYEEIDEEEEEEEEEDEDQGGVIEIDVGEDDDNYEGEEEEYEDYGGEGDRGDDEEEEEDDEEEEEEGNVVGEQEEYDDDEGEEEEYIEGGDFIAAGGDEEDEEGED